MKLLPIILSFPLVSLLGEGVKADLWIDEYQRKDGTSVKGHWKTKPNNSIYDNYSYPGNFNPNKKTFTPKTSPYGINNSSPYGSSGYKSKPQCRDSSIVISGICGY